jgi:hypothetical protein
MLRVVRSTSSKQLQHIDSSIIEHALHTEPEGHSSVGRADKKVCHCWATSAAAGTAVADVSLLLLVPCYV